MNIGADGGSPRRDAAMMLMTRVALHAHSGPPFPIVLDQIAGPYKVSIWTDPDATDDGSAAGKFWVMVDPVGKGLALPPGTRVTVSIQPLDRPGPIVTGRAKPVGQMRRAGLSRW